VSLIMAHNRYSGIVYAGADAASQQRLNMAFRVCLRYIHSLRKLDHVSHLATSVLGASLAGYARIQLLLFLYKVMHVRHPCFLFLLFRFDSSARTRNLVVPAHRSLAMSQSFVVLGCKEWNVMPHDMKILPMQALFVPAVKRMVRHVDASNCVIYLFLRTCLVSVAPTTLLDVMTVCY
jgi:hypothetical protein